MGRERRSIFASAFITIQKSLEGAVQGRRWHSI